MNGVGCSIGLRFRGGIEGRGVSGSGIGSSLRGFGCRCAALTVSRGLTLELSVIYVSRKLL